MTEPRSDLTPLPDLLHEQPTAGPSRHQRPVYVDLLPPRNAACPAGEDIRGWLALAAGAGGAGKSGTAGGPEAAWRRLVADNPLPAVHGRVCYHPCETSCNRAQLDSAVSIHAVERFLGDQALQRGWMLAHPRSAAAAGCWSSAADPVGCRLPTTWPGWDTRWRSGMRPRRSAG